MKKFFYLIIIALTANIVLAQKPETFEFAEKDGQILKMDVYTPDDDLESHPCILFYFGGGFISGARNDSVIVKFCETMAYEHGFVAIAADYRLGLKGVKKFGFFNNKPVRDAIYMATDDAITALYVIITHSKELKINTEKIIIGGSSAGATIALQTDYFICNGLGNSEILPDDFHLAGVIPFAGAIFSVDGKIKYKDHSPAPTMFFHGVKDRLVPYNQTKFFNIGYIGTNKIVKQFKKFDYPYFFRKYENYAHGVALFFNENVDDIMWFYETYIEKSTDLQIDETVNFAKNAPKLPFDPAKRSEYYK